MKAHVLYRPASFRAASALAKLLPRSGLRALACAMGWGYWALHTYYRRVVASNLARVSPDDPRRVRDLTRSTFLNFARSLADYCALADLSREQLNGIFAEINGREHLDAALALGRGVILVTAHLGNWELGGLAIARAGYSLRVITAEEPTPALTAQRERYRAVYGIGTIKLGNSPFSFLEAMAALRENQIVAMLVDRPYSSAVEVNFFGAPLRFSAAPAALAQATRAAILPAFVTLTTDGRYHAQVQPPIPFVARDDPEQTLRENTQRLADVFERIVREHPDQWFHFVPLWK